MKHHLMSSRTAAAIFVISAASSLFGSSFEYVDFSSIAGLDLNGSAVQAGQALRLTPASPFTAGSAYADQKQQVQMGFRTSFRFALSAATGQPADGFAFLVQSASPAAIGPSGGALGYFGIPNSLAVEFDTFPNVPPLTDYGDPNGNHIAIQSCGTAPNTPSHLTGCTLGIQTSLPARLADGGVHRVDLTYTPGSMLITLDGIPTLSASVDLGTLLSLNSGKAWVGFTGATGGGWENNDVLSWSFTNESAQSMPEPTTFAFVGVTLLALGLLRGLRARSLPKWCILAGLMLALLTVAPATAQDSSGFKTILNGDLLSEGFALGVDSSGARRDWLTKGEGFLRMDYPANQAFGAVFVTIGTAVNPPRPSQDFSSYSTLSIEMKNGGGSSTIEIGIKTNTQADNGTETKIQTKLSPSWQIYEFPLSQFTGADLSRLYVVPEFVFTGPNPQTVYFRNIRLLRRGVSTNIIRNGGFETGPDPGSVTPLSPGQSILDGWRVGLAGVDYIGSLWTPSQGSRSIHLGAQGNTGGEIEQTFATVPGDVYRVSFDEAGNPAAGPAVKMMLVSAGSASMTFPFDVTGRSMSQMGWISRELNFVATDLNATLRFQNTLGASAGPALDNVAVIWAPPAIAAAAHSAALKVVPVTRNEIVSLFGNNLANASASAIENPLPMKLSGSAVSITDTAGVARPCALFFASAGQINLLIPSETALGPATFKLATQDGSVSLADVAVVSVSPGIFTANADGVWVPAATYVRSGGSGAPLPVFRFDSTQKKFVPAPIDLGSDSDQVFLSLYGTGMRDGHTASAFVGGQSVPVIGPVAQSQFAGLDQINLGPLPRTLAGKGQVAIVVKVDDVAANVVAISIQ